jgi:hypothetical protein
MINAKPQLNGNSEKDFFDAALALSRATSEVEEALGGIRANVFHGRNYQAQDAGWTDFQQNSARKGDAMQMENALKAVRELQAFAKAIADKALADA